MSDASPVPEARDARSKRQRTKQAFGDWQTPLTLARAAVEKAASALPVPATVLEPTCGEGAFLEAASQRFPDARLVGYEINETYAATARGRLPSGRARIEVADFFGIDWERVLADLPEPILVVGNPPWVTSATLGAIEHRNLPPKTNFKALSGLDARTGKSNFDVSEWMLLRLIDALRERHAHVFVLCKASVARRVIEIGSKDGSIAPGSLWRIDSKRSFDAAVDAVLFAFRLGSSSSAAPWPVYDALDAARPSSSIAVVDGVAVADSARLEKTAHLVGTSRPEWRSGIKHDCARVMELEVVGDELRNGLGEIVDIEPFALYPLLKGSDVARGSARKARAVVVPQHALGEDTGALEERAPKTWAYLRRHAALLAARKSSIYRGQPDFAIFGIGPYSFAPYKVAISALHKRCAFTVVGPQEGRPVMLDDTCYFLPFDDEGAARRASEALTSPIAHDFFAARIFWDAKRPISKAVLQRLDLDALQKDVRLHA